MRQAAVNRETSDCPDSAIPSSLEEPDLIPFIAALDDGIVAQYHLPLAVPAGDIREFGAPSQVSEDVIVTVEPAGLPRVLAALCRGVGSTGDEVGLVFS